MTTILEALKDAEAKATDEVIVPRNHLRRLIDAAEALRGFNMKPQSIVAAQGDFFVLRIPIAAITTAAKALEALDAPLP